MKAVPYGLGFLCLALAGACDDGRPFDAGPSELAISGGGVTVMTRNLYVGADVDAVIAAIVSPDPADDLPALAAAIQMFGETDFSRRAGAIADEIARTRPHVVGLQEVSDIDLSLPPLGVDIHQRFLPILLSALAARGLDYAVTAQVQNIDAAPLPGVQLVDYDVLLTDRERVTVIASGGKNFSANLGTVAPGVTLQRGYVTADATIGGVGYTFASTHLESGNAAGLAGLRAVQIGELAQELSGKSRVVVMGDLNDAPDSPMHLTLSNAGFLDVWAVLRPGTAGYTCCHATDLANVAQTFDQRLDYVWSRGLGQGSGAGIGQVALVGEVPADRIAGPSHSIWPSDHAGLVALLRP